MISIRSIPVFLFGFLFLGFQNSSFETQQKAFPRVAEAYKNKETAILATLASNKIAPSSLQILIGVFKKEQKLELWAKSQNQPKMQRIKSYDICQSSGRLGPKRKQLDGQVPEGFYEVGWFNPESAFHLSLGLNYPNASDRILGEKGNLGSAIMIHGSCVTIGCIPMTDPIIEEIYVYAVKARNAGQVHIPIYVFPGDLSGDGLKAIMEEQVPDRRHFAFWKNLKEGYDQFEKEKNQLTFQVDKAGKYKFER
jgi:murein L,D-transpeptidase YafK